MVALTFTACGSGSKTEVSTQTTPDSNSGAGSTSGSRGAGSSSPTDLCSIITAEDAAAVFGEPATAQESTAPEPLAVGVCLYGGESEDFTVRNLLQVRVYEGEQFYGREIFKDAKPLANLGDEAFVYFNDPGNSVDVQFLKDGKTGTVNYTAGQSVDIESKIPELERVARRLAASI